MKQRRKLPANPNIGSGNSGSGNGGGGSGSSSSSGRNPTSNNSLFPGLTNSPGDNIKIKSSGAYNISSSLSSGMYGGPLAFTDPNAIQNEAAQAAFLASMLPCEICGRTFLPDRLVVHMRGPCGKGGKGGSGSGSRSSSTSPSLAKASGRSPGKASTSAELRAQRLGGIG